MAAAVAVDCGITRAARRLPAIPMVRAIDLIWFIAFTFYRKSV